MVIDRYFYSGIVYSAAKGDPTLGLEWARGMEVGLPLPDLCLFLDVAPGVVVGRGGFGGERYETGGMQERVRGGFLALMGGVDGGGMRVVDAGRGVEVVEGKVWGVVEGVMGGLHERGGLGSVAAWGRVGVER